MYFYILEGKQELWQNLPGINEIQTILPLLPYNQNPDLNQPLQIEVLPECYYIPKPVTESGNNRDQVQEVVNHDDIRDDVVCVIENTEVKRSELCPSEYSTVRSKLLT